MLPTAPYDRAVTGHIARPLYGVGLGHVYEYPRRACAGAHVDPGDVIGWPSEAAPTTTEAVASGPVGPLGVAAARAALRGVGRVHLDERHTGTVCLVLDEHAELVKRPGGLPCSLVASNRDPLADALELFQGNTTFGAFCDSNDSLGDLMVDMGGVPGFPTCTLFEELH